jgi:hypothetical protein
VGSAASSAKTQLDAMITTIKDEQNAGKDALQEKLDNYTKEIDAQKALLTAKQEEIDYEDTLAEKEKAVSTIQNELAALALDNSEEAKNKRLTLQADLATKQADLEKTQTDQSFKLQQTALDNQLSLYKDFIDAQIKMIDDYLKNVVQLTADAIKRLGQQTGQSGGGSGSSSSSKSVASGLEKQISAQISSYAGNYSSDPNAYGTTYSSGGEVTGGMPGYDSVTGKLTPGEYVLKANVAKSIGIPALNALNRGIPSVNSIGGGGGLTIGGNLMNIEVNGSLDKSVIPDIERISNGVMDQLNKALRNRGYLRAVNQFS